MICLKNFNICLYFVILISINSLTCPIYYDYTKQTVTCTTTCPFKSSLIDNKCLLSNQYILQNQVHLCEKGYTSKNKDLCCQKGQCLICNGNIYQNGRYCCSNNQYINYAASSLQCTKIGTGNCPNITLTSQYKVCCQTNLFYHVQMKQCVNRDNNNFNCDLNSKLCCNLNHKLQYLKQEQKYACVKDCEWGIMDSFRCIQKFCNGYNQSLISSQSLIRNNFNENSTQFQRKNNFLLSLNNQSCCIGVSTSGQCIKTQSQCGKRFINRGWSICCAHGLYYSVQLKICITNCQQGFILFEILCIPNNNYLDLSGPSSSHPVLTMSSICNFYNLLSQMPVCCPRLFYLNGKNGCQYCSGTIHLISTSQICCKFNQYYDKNLQICKICQGKVDKTGTLCCLSTQYIKYSSNSIGSCTQKCLQQNIYKTQYCCESLTNQSCLLNSYLPTKCNSEYFIESTCQICPNYCSNIGICTKGSQNTCIQKSCEKNSIYLSDIDECLSCDISCNQCKLPFDNSACIQCSIGYVFLNQICTKCFIECKTCQNKIDSCTSCYQDSNKPFLENGKCLTICGNGTYNQIQNTCQSCHFNCIQCQGRRDNQCMKCSKNNYLSLINMVSGACLVCDNQCQTCFQTATNCITCKNGMKYNSNTKKCISQCGVSQIFQSYSNSSRQICYSCHQTCRICASQSQNCLTCKNSTQFLDDKLGLQLCTPCFKPCLSCFSQQNCTSCIEGYYLNSFNRSCLICYEKCKTCQNGAQNGCLTCLGDLQVNQGRCVGCTASCNKCDLNNTNNCLQCKSPNFLYKGICISQCPMGFHGLSANNSCQPCFSLCKTCINGLQNGCSQCKDTSMKLIQGKCVGCSTNCLKCGQDLICTQCNNDFILYQQSCVTNCPSGTFKYLKICQKCPVNCSTCISLTNCTTCKPQAPILFINQCLSNCPQGYKKSPNQNTCIQQSNNFGDSSSIILSQTFVFDNKQKIGYLTVYFNNSVSAQTMGKFLPLVKFSLINLQNGLNKNIQTYLSQVDFINKKAIYKVGPIQTDTIRDFDASLTSIKQSNSNQLNNNNNSLVYNQVSTQIYSQLLVEDYRSISLSNIKIIGIIVSIILLTYALLSKLKSHFLAQQANSIILHAINFTQVVYLFKHICIHQDGVYGFLQGFGWTMLSFFPNFFQYSIPNNYIQTTKYQSLIPDGNMIRNVGFVYSYQLIIIGLFIIAFLISFILFKTSSIPQLPQIRKIMRIFIFFLHLGFLPLLFFSFLQIIIPSKIQIQHRSFHILNIVLSYVNIILIPIIMIVIFYHFYQTYNSDILEHYYTLREGVQYIQIFLQSVILLFAIGRPLIGLLLIPLEGCWLGFNFVLYKYGQGYTVREFLKFIVCSVAISLGYLMLSLSQLIVWQILVVFLCIVVVTLVFYGIYQVVGLYYNYLFGNTQSNNNSKLQKIN